MVLVANPPPSVFEGIYDLPEAARYLKAARHSDEVYPVSSTNLTRWIRHGLASPDLRRIQGRDLLIAFEDLISMRVIAALRAAKVSWPAIYTAEQLLRSMTRARRPFATETVWTGQGEVFAEFCSRLISVSRHGQMGLDLLREYLISIHGLTFNEVHKADTWEPVFGVVFDPLLQFGAPCLKGTRIPTRTISGMIEAGDTASWVAEAYGLSNGEVHTALDWESRLKST